MRTTIFTVVFFLTTVFSFGHSIESYDIMSNIYASTFGYTKYYLTDKTIGETKYINFDYPVKQTIYYDSHAREFIHIIYERKPVKTGYSVMPEDEDFVLSNTYTYKNVDLIISKTGNIYTYIFKLVVGPIECPIISFNSTHTLEETNGNVLVNQWTMYSPEK